MSVTDIRYFIKLAITFLGSTFCWFIGKYDGIFYTLVAFITADYISGVACAIYERKLSSEVGFRGIAKKVLIIILVGIANLLDMYVLKTADILRVIVGMYYIANEGLSIVENAVRLGLPVPKKLRDVLVQLKNKGDTEDGSAEQK